MAAVEDQNVLFRKQKRYGGMPAAQLETRDKDGDSRSMYGISLDLMLKGSFHKRSGVKIRQFGVTVRGATCMVTSGDIVDQQTYDALIAAGAIRTEAAAAKDEEEKSAEAAEPPEDQPETD